MDVCNTRTTNCHHHWRWFNTNSFWQILNKLFVWWTKNSLCMFTQCAILGWLVYPVYFSGGLVQAGPGWCECAVCSVKPVWAGPALASLLLGPSLRGPAGPDWADRLHWAEPSLATLYLELGLTTHSVTQTDTSIGPREPVSDCVTSASAWAHRSGQEKANICVVDRFGGLWFTFWLWL